MKNRRRRRVHLNHLRNPITWVGLIIIPLLLLLLWEGVGNLIWNFQPESTATQEPLFIEDLNRPISDMYPLIEEQKHSKSSPRVYPYSVVDGGVHSVWELRSAIWRDPVVAKHYSNFNLDTARVIEAKADGDFHVSYRIGKEIFWTKKRLKVAKGEKLITDGTNFTRTRCANVLSEVIPGKTSPNELTPQAFDTPKPPPSDLTPVTLPGVNGGGPPVTTFPPSDSAPFTLPVVFQEGPPASTLPPEDFRPVTAPGVTGEGLPVATFPPSGFTPLVPIGGGSSYPAGGSEGGGGDNYIEGNSSVPAPVPEPNTLLLLGSGILTLAGYGMRKFFKK